MKKKAIATLALAGALAATMMPAFAANVPSDQTTVGYIAGGNVSPNGKVMVTVPKNVTFTNEVTTFSGFNVEAKVWDANTQSWIAPTADGVSMGGAVTVNVNSANNFKFKNGNNAAEGSYEYKTTGAAIANDGLVGTLNDGAATITGTVTLTKAPASAQDGNAVEYKDTLTFSFSGGAFQGS